MVKQIFKNFYKKIFGRRYGAEADSNTVSLLQKYIDGQITLSELQERVISQFAHT